MRQIKRIIKRSHSHLGRISLTIKDLRAPHLKLSNKLHLILTRITLEMTTKLILSVFQGMQVSRIDACTGRVAIDCFSLSSNEFVSRSANCYLLFICYLFLQMMFLIVY